MMCMHIYMHNISLNLHMLKDIIDKYIRRARYTIVLDSM